MNTDERGYGNGVTNVTATATATTTALATEDTEDGNGDGDILVTTGSTIGQAVAVTKFSPLPYPRSSVFIRGKKPLPFVVLR
jgi:hypothetical protein